VKGLNEIQAMNKDLLKHMVVRAQMKSTTEMRDKIHVLDWDMLSTYGQDDLHQSVFAARETLLELESESRFLR
jgi:hypothetical protein